jgi:hypothetical protein
LYAGKKEHMIEHPEERLDNHRKPYLVTSERFRLPGGDLGMHSFRTMLRG